MARRPVTFKGSRPIEGAATARRRVRNHVGVCRKAAAEGNDGEAQLAEKEALLTALYLITMYGLGAEECASIADEALKTVDIEFNRRYA